MSDIKIGRITPISLNCWLVEADGVPLRVFPAKGESPEVAVRTLLGPQRKD